MPKIPLKVLVACEFSGIVREAFRKRGCNAWSCDLLPTEIPGLHIQSDCLKVLNDGWDLMIAHPPCTHLAVSGAPSFFKKQKLQEDALDFFLELLNAPIPQICVENPVSVAGSRIAPCSQIIQPYEFGDPQRKTTCLWLRALPKLYPTQYVLPRLVTTADGRTDSEWHYNTFRLPKEIRGHERSRTFPGIAAAMASQWSDARNYCYRSQARIRLPSGYTKKPKKCKD